MALRKLPWFRMYAEFATDAKVQIMPEVMQRRLLMLFCLRCSNDLVTLQCNEIAFQLRISDAELAKTKALFLRQGFINDDWEILNWEQRQFSSDSSAERVAEHRRRKKEQEKKDVTLQSRSCNAIDTDTETDKEQKTLGQNSIGFSKFWAAYPKKKSKGAAEKAFKSIKPDAQLLEAMLKAIERAKISPDWLKDGGAFIPHPATWLRAKGWEDEFTAPIPKGQDSSKPWFDTASGVINRGAELGLTIADGEPFPHFKARVYKAAGWGPWVERELDAAHRVNPDFAAKVERFYEEIRP